MTETFKLQSLRGRPVVNIENGESIGTVEDIRISTDTKAPVGLVTNKGGLFNRDVRTVPADAVQVWGKDVILVRGSAAPGTMADAGRWISANDHLRGHYVVSTDGMRVGQVDDVLIDEHGRLAALELGQVFIASSLSQSKRLPADAIRTLGKDVIIADLANLPIDETADTAAGARYDASRVGNYPAP